jgi:hypothetical protein
MASRSLTLIALFGLLVSVTAGCQGIRLNNRNDVKGAPGLIASQYEPEDEESCSEVGQTNCRYWSNPMKSAQAACAEEQSGEAESLGANYIHVNEASSSVGGFKTRGPIATFYKCAALIQR